MFHEFIDFKKKAKNGGFNNEKSLRNSIETCTADQSGSEWPSTTFVPPWLNNLGLKLKNNHVRGTFDHRTEKLNPDIKNQNQYQQNPREVTKQTFAEDDPNKSCYFRSSQKGYEEEGLRTSESYQKLPSVEKRNRREGNGVSQIPVVWRVRPKVINIDSSSADSVMRPLSSGKKNFKTCKTEVSLGSSADVRQINSEQKNSRKILKKQVRNKHQTVSGLEIPGHDRIGFGEINVDSILEERAREILENYEKKKIHSTASDIKHFEAKLILLQSKIRLGKLTTEDVKLLEEVKTRAGNKENFNKLMRHVKEINLKEIIEAQNCILNSLETNKNAKAAKTHPRKEGRTLLSTDDENDIKRFSELLRKNQNEVEKRKCLEEVRNYFERKRRARLTKCWLLNASSKKSSIKGKEDLTDDEADTQKDCSDKLDADWRSKFSINDAELVGKAVDETLQKFVEMYHFHVSPSVMISLKDSVLKDIRSHSLEDETTLAKHNVPPNVEGENLSSKLQKNITGKDSPEKESLSKNLKTKNFIEKTLSGPRPEGLDASVLKKEQMERLKSELEYCINSASKDFTNLKIERIIFEEPSENSSGKNKKFIYSFSNKFLGQNKSGLKTDTTSTLCLKDEEVQVDKTSIAVNANTQTQKLVNVYAKYVETEKNLQTSVDVQTEGTYAFELKNLKETDVSAGLYRMVKSKQAGKFYLYPENNEQANNPSKENKENNKSNSFSEKFRPKRPSRKLEHLDPDKKEKEIIVSEVLIDDSKESKKKSDAGCFQPEKKFVWLWDGETINLGADLKARVESLLMEKLKEMSFGFLESQENMWDCNSLTRSSVKECQTDFQENLTFKMLRSGSSLGKGDTGFRLKNEAGNLGEESAETQSIEKLAIPAFKEKLVKDASTQNSEKAFLSFRGKTRQTSKAIYSMRNKQKTKMKKDRQSMRSVVDLKSAVQLMNNYCLHDKKMKYEANGSGKKSTGGSGSTLDSNTSFCSKETSDGCLTLVFGKGNLDVKNKKNKEMQINSRNNSKIENMTEIEGSTQVRLNQTENHMHWELIERLLHRVNCSEKERLWNDVRELIKSKIGKDIDNEDAKEVCIQIEQEGKAKYSMLVKGHYIKNEGNVEVEVDLTPDDLERIILRRERSRGRRRKYFRRYSRSLRLSSQGQSKSNFSSIQEFRKILKNVSRSRPSPLPEDVEVMKINKQD